jgi:transcriptional regulator with XRE-family HTH domain
MKTLQIGRAREKRGKTQAEVAFAMNIPKSTLCQWESGKRNVAAYMLPRLADVIGCEIEDLFC